MWDFISDLWEGAWELSPIAGILVLLLYIALALLALGVALALLMIALTIVAIAVTIFVAILAGCMVYGSAVGIVRSFINYFGALKDELGA